MCAVESFEFNYVVTLQILRLLKKNCNGIVELILVTSVPRLTHFLGSGPSACSWKCFLNSGNSHLELPKVLYMRIW